MSSYEISCETHEAPSKVHEELHADTQLEQLKPTTTSFKKLVTHWWLEWRFLITVLLVMIIFRSVVADWNQVPTGSMQPTILIGDRIVVNKLAYDLKVPFTTWHIADWSAPKHGDVVTFYSPSDNKLLIKRIIGVPGDLVEMHNNQLFVNGHAASYSRLSVEVVNQLDYYKRSTHTFYTEKYLQSEHGVMVKQTQSNHYGDFAALKIPTDMYWVLGDNRDNSRDSRKIGLVPRENITGRAHTVAFSLDYDNHYMPRYERFFRPL